MSEAVAQTETKKRSAAFYVAAGCAGIVGVGMLSCLGFGILGSGLLGEMFDIAAPTGSEASFVPVPPIPGTAGTNGPTLPPPEPRVVPLGTIAQGVQVVRFRVERIEGTAPLAAGTECDFRVETSGAGMCRSQITCVGRAVYGSESGGYYPCTFAEGVIAGGEEQTTQGDSDPAIRIDSGTSTLQIRDDAAGPYGAFVIDGTILAVLKAM